MAVQAGHCRADGPFRFLSHLSLPTRTGFGATCCRVAATASFSPCGQRPATSSAAATSWRWAVPSPWNARIDNSGCRFATAGIAPAHCSAPARTTRSVESVYSRPANSRARRRAGGRPRRSPSVPEPEVREGRQPAALATRRRGNDMRARPPRSRRRPPARNTGARRSSAGAKGRAQPRHPRPGPLWSGGRPVRQKEHRRPPAPSRVAATRPSRHRPGSPADRQQSDRDAGEDRHHGHPRRRRSRPPLDERALPVEDMPPRRPAFAGSSTGAKP